MNSIYKSDERATFTLKYLIPLVIVNFYILNNISLQNIYNFLSYKISFEMLEIIASNLTVLWFLVWQTIIIIQLRRVEVSNENLIMKTIFGDEVIEYKDILWISQNALINPLTVSLKYKDEKSNDVKTILIIPRRDTTLFKPYIYEDHEMILFIRDKVKEANTDYLEEEERSRFKPVMLLIITGILTFLMMYLISELTV